MMKTTAQFLFLGTGGSMGIPVIGCRCEVCSSPSLYNKRMRPSGLIKVNDKKVLIDAGPDHRNQALIHHIDRLDGVIFTHAHYDHSGGIDDLRVYYMHTQQALECLMSKATYEELKYRYAYIFQQQESYKLITQMRISFLESERGETNFSSLRLRYFTYEQGGMAVNGFKCGNLSFVSDIRHYPESIFEDLAGTEILIISALRFNPSPLHLTVDEALAFSEKVKAKQVWFTHIAHELDHDQTNAYLPSHVRLAYDGLSLNFSPQFA
ncbi:MBL fold metallo-hydrolase [Parachlamydia sp. AcF125]|uniref:MBL fold metallo-hydrolase n=1 Tax=Parachlamydia sp. AcF125 TaxID=2795736 RepID=UPI001BD8B59A|nr:MBL fold metallo-hydrolase [Parachlamydia sp. AcF125]MBS4168380.1 Phosphoribosyl 1,2-cyclic phosphate phosphodiesterase [Parachlamydia sp. AcF125]